MLGVLAGMDQIGSYLRRLLLLVTMVRVRIVIQWLLFHLLHCDGLA